MAGNSQRRGAVRKTGSKKGATVGSGGQRRRGLEGKGPTPKASDRPNHKAHKFAKAAAKSGSSRPQRPQRRTKASSEMVAGRNSVLEALRADIPVATMYVAGRIDADDRVREALKIAGERGIPILETPRGELDRLTDDAVHQGLAIQVPPYEYAHPSDFVDPQTPGIPLVVALDGITDPRNLGAIIRSVAAFGGHGVVVPARRSVGMTASAWKTSAGAAARIPVAQVSNLNQALKDFKKAGFFVIGLDMDGDVELPDLELASEPLVIVVGSEGKGLSKLVGENCDQIVSVPMSSAVESLNAGIAAGVTLYEVARRRR
ncbi:MAG: 23S rRNA (guanosine(2251)-2'-O)-methyltransferase RlmB [Phycicoccus sp.]|jgi:23S rRNA (guanosine2251-2'-O)-methyltransferase|uniref:23S rRNA (guanosine(2251)-2'-O)-methyltransferase RlmB n=2 Tax=Intrasporangiaceae TaxID=85021 RepID=UPI002589827A|nr:23S rRNA (guanosine(2251)-2'-O)-methyltransferase RlmB [Phycicoccus sp.]MBK8728774.1 23S rRNA (guanosine(2251)-2'-O)-methyltransferase RlmB [Tetrasphaera sp.]MCA0321728.1 23S rRNA (guanosine(2251)-2'-O)-methyltransferase RlmB [Actinomycetota bacterium]MCB9406931.1 23S rRNA (guanosine(2251)-2'-O)-methyltransferase RlmB [Tetrasphaera sp.]MCO5302909.1 23S rRNA (guanosine(2251)-2'-O)-methyltransferase RlmB [Phycicoccus sp.]